MADKKFQNEDPSVLLAFRLTIQVREDKATLAIQTDAGVLYPTTRVLSTTKRIEPGGGVQQAIQRILAAHPSYLPDVMAALEAPEEEW